MAKLLFACLLSLMTFGPLEAGAVEGDENWSSDFALPGADDTVFASIEFEGDLVVGGAFRHMGICAATSVARWNGSDWSPMGDGFDGAVRVLEIYEGALYAGGDFDNSGSTSMNGIARWDGIAWQPLGEQLDYASIRALCAYQGNLIAGGIADWDVAYEEYYEIAGLAEWNGLAWTEIAEFEWGFSGCIDDLAVYTGDLIAVGDFQGIDGDWGISGVARYDGQNWHDFGQLITPNALLLHENELYCGGGELFRWSGQEWETVGGMFVGTMQDIVSYAGGIAACGDIVVDGIHGTGFWDGNAWTLIGESFGNAGNMSTPTLYSVGIFGDQLIAGGDFRQVGANAIPRLAAWDGESWGALYDPENIPQFGGLDRNPYALGLHGGHIITGGPFDFGFNATLNGLGLWDGGAWRSLGGGTAEPSEFVTDMQEYQGGLVVSGDFEAFDGIPIPNLAYWTGSEWQAFASTGMPYPCLHVWSDGPRLYCSGRLYDGGFTYPIKCWDGESWSDMDGGLNSAVADMIFQDGYVVACGSFTADAHGQELRHVARWDGEAWRPMGTGFDNTANCLVEWEGKIVAGGRFTSADGQAADHLASWDGQGWTPFPGGPDGYVIAITVFHGDLIIGGGFNVVSGQEVNGIARWDGESWTPMGSGFALTEYYGSYVDDFAVQSDSLFVCGNFRNAGGNPSYGIACWTDESSGIEEGGHHMPNLSAANWPNPFNPRTNIQFSLPSSSKVTLRICDPQGREVRRLLDAAPGMKGENRLLLDGRDDAGNALPSGVYLCEVEAGPYRATEKMTLLK